MDEKKIKQAVTKFLEGIGENPRRDGLKETPSRVAEMCKEIFAGYKAGNILKIIPAGKHENIVIIKDISFYSFCEHHLLPFFGKACIAYLPDKKTTGLSKLARLIEVFSKRLTLQERLSEEVACAIVNALKPKGVLVCIEATHLCLSMRGIKKQGAKVVTISAKGEFLRREKQEEILRLMR